MTTLLYSILKYPNNRVKFSLHSTLLHSIIFYFIPLIISYPNIAWICLSLKWKEQILKMEKVISGYILSKFSSSLCFHWVYIHSYKIYQRWTSNFVQICSRYLVQYTGEAQLNANIFSSLSAHVDCGFVHEIRSLLFAISSFQLNFPRTSIFVHKKKRYLV